jgi:cell division protein FtsQ
MKHASGKGWRLLRRSTGNRRLKTGDQRKLSMLSIWYSCKRIGLGLGLLVLAATATIGIYYGYQAVKVSPRFLLKDVVVSGNRVVTKDEILSYGGLSTGMPIMSIDPAIVAERIQKHPWLKDAQVRRVLPDQLAIEVNERVAKAAVYLDELYLTDDEGEAFLPACAAQIDTLPIITGIDRLFYTTHPDEARRLIKMAVDLADDMGDAQVLKKFSLAELHVDPHSGIEIELTPGPLRLHLGWADYGQKLARAQSVLDGLAQKGKSARAIYLDNERRPNRLIVRLASQS